MKQIYNREKINPVTRGILMASHGPFATALYESICMILGEIDNLAAFSLEAGDDPDEFGKLVQEAYQSFPEGSILLLDLKGGTPFNQAFIQSAQSGKPIYSLCAMSLTMVAAAFDLRDDFQGRELIQKIKEMTIEGMYEFVRD